MSVTITVRSTDQWTLTALAAIGVALLRMLTVAIFAMHTMREPRGLAAAIDSVLTVRTREGTIVTIALVATSFERGAHRAMLRATQQTV